MDKQRKKTNNENVEDIAARIIKKHKHAFEVMANDED